MTLSIISDLSCSSMEERRRDDRDDREDRRRDDRKDRHRDNGNDRHRDDRDDRHRDNGNDRHRDDRDDRRRDDRDNDNDSRRERRRRADHNDILSILKEDERFTKIAKIVEKSDVLSDSLRDRDVTFFAPTNMAINRFLELAKNIGGDSNEKHLEEIVKYHIVAKKVPLHEMYEGLLLETELTVEDLGKKHERQKIVVGKILGSVALNRLARVDELGLVSSNGLVHPIDWILVPPKKLTEQLFRFPFKCSTFVSAIQACDLVDVMSKKGLTCLVPLDSAWKQMNMNDLFYLFSPLGRHDLKKILEYHICDELWYAEKILENINEPIELHSMLKKEKIKIEVKSCIERKKRVKPEECMMVINDGEAIIKITDCVAENGTAHCISNVLIPEVVIKNLPSKRESTMRSFAELDI